MKKITLLFVFLFSIVSQGYSQVPINDDCSNAIVINCGDVLTGQDTTGATGGTSVSCVGTIGDEIWYQFTSDGSIVTLTATATSTESPQIQVYESTDGTCNGFTPGTCFASAGSGESAPTVTFQTVAGTQYFIQIGSWINGDPATIFDLSMTCIAPPTCIEPTGITSSNITTTSATVSWITSVTDPANGYVYYLSTTNTAPLSTDTPTDLVVAGTTSVDLINLSSGTNYYIWVRSVCSATDSSAWSVMATFATLCDPIGVPYLQDFESAAVPALPICTSNENIGTGNNWTTTSSPGGYGFSTNVLNYVYSSTDSADTWFYTQGITLDAGTSYDISYKYGNNSTTYIESMKVAYGVSPTSTDMTNPIADHPSITGGVFTGGIAQQNLVSFTPSVSGVYYFGFNAYSAPDQYYLYVDDIKVVATPSCSIPTALVVSSLTNNGATISWTAPANAPANGYEYYLSTTNTTPLSSDSATDFVVAGITTANLTGLTASTTYYVWVRSVCSSSDSSEWGTMASFQTLCDSVIDFSENFDAAVAFPTCWARVGTGGNTYVQASSSAPSQPNNLYLYGTSATSQGVVSMIPVSNAGDATHRLRFKARANFTVGGHIEVGYLSNPSDATTFVGLQTFTTTSTTVYDSFTAYLGTDPGSNQVLAFRHTGSPANSVLIDDVVWEVIPSCVEPTSLTSTAITTATATISWTAPVALPSNGYDYYVSTSNTAPSSTTVATGSVAAGITTANLSGLASSSVYYFWVRSVCSSFDASVWSLSGTFTTLCTSVAAPYTQDFESAVTPALPICTSNQNVGLGNNWTVVSNPTYGFTSKCLRYAYNASNPANAWFYTQGVTLTGGVAYDISYKYGNNSTTYVESMKVSYGTSPVNTAMTNPIADHPSITGGTSGGTAQQNLVTFTPSVSGDYFFGFNAYSITDQYYLFVDDISITANLANSTFSNSNFTFYPNPVKDVLNVSNSATISKVQVVNLLGQEMISKSINDTQGQVDMTQLAAGTYLVKLTSEDQIKTIKVIKE